MIGLWTKTEAGLFIVLLVLEILGLGLAMSSGTVILGAILVIAAALGQIAVALSFRARRRRAGTWRSHRP